MDTTLLTYLRSYLTERRQALFTEILDKRTKHFTVVTEDVYQLHNTSAVMRSCDAFGIQDLHVVEELDSKRIDKEIAMGAQKWVTLHRYDSIEHTMQTMRDKGYQIIATVPAENASVLHEFNVTKKSAFFFGKESTGLSDAVLENADGFLKVPMYGFTESLNISVAAAIILQHVVTRLKATDIDWQLTKEEKLAIEIEWAKNTIKYSDEIVERFLQDKKQEQ